MQRAIPAALAAFAAEAAAVAVGAVGAVGAVAGLFSKKYVENEMLALEPCLSN